MADRDCILTDAEIEQADCEAIAAQACRRAAEHEYDHLTGHLEAGMIAEDAAFACRRAGDREGFLGWAAAAELAFASTELVILTDVSTLNVAAELRQVAKAVQVNRDGSMTYVQKWPPVAAGPGL